VGADPQIRALREGQTCRGAGAGIRPTSIDVAGSLTEGAMESETRIDIEHEKGVYPFHPEEKERM
jgi:hypothetical protein